MQEFFPFASGFVVGLVLCRVRPALNARAIVVAAVIVGLLSTILSGEFRVSWGFLLFDVPAAAVAVVMGYVFVPCMQRLQARLSEAPRL